MTFRAVIPFLLAALACVAADDDWSKVAAIKSGSEIRVVRKGKPQPLVGKMDEARPETLVLVVKNEQMAIPKEEIERVDARPNASKMTKTETVNNQPAYEAPGTPNRPTRPGGPSGSASSGVSFGKADFETVYRRKAGQ
jgi:hypothetical protein